jgi:RNA polymerase primary sigma factor
VEELDLYEHANRIQWVDGNFEMADMNSSDLDSDDEYLPLDEVLASEDDEFAQLEDLLGEADEDQEDEDELEEVALSRAMIEDPVNLYFSRMSQVPLLTSEEEVELAKQMEKGREAQKKLSQNGHNPEEAAVLNDLIEKGREARQRFIESNTRLVVSIAKKYRGHGMPFSDLIQAGNLGLIKAVDKFDYRQGNKFSTYATWWIRQSVTRSLSQQSRTIRIPVHLGDRLRRLYKRAQKLEQDLGRQPTPEEIAEEVGLQPRKLRRMLRIWQHPLSLNKPLGEEDDSELGSFIEDEETPSPSDLVQQSLLQEDLQKVMHTLTPREARVLSLRFGLQDNPSCTLREIGEKLGVSRERVRQIEYKALRKLRHPRHRLRLWNHWS